MVTVNGSLIIKTGRRASSNFCEQKFVPHVAITIAIDCNGLCLLIFEEKLPHYASGPKSAPNSNSFWVRRLFNVCVRAFSAPNVTILLVVLHLKRWFFVFAKIGIFCKSIEDPLSEAKFKCKRNHHISERIKLMICQIRHEPSVTNHEISTSWKKIKKTFNGGPYKKVFQ